MVPVSSSPAIATARQTPFGEEVYRGLTSAPKTLSPWLFYDSEGSQLFEQITRLPEYYVTRTERAIFDEHADAIIALASKVGSPQPLAAIELGAGTAAKTGLLLQAAVRRQGQIDYYAIDVSESALDEAKEHLEAEIAGVHVHARVADYTDGLGQIDIANARRLVLYIGSSIGNFEPENAEALLADIRRQLQAGDCLLLGADQVKPLALLAAAYDDASGVTAAFNKNVLTRINRELDANFDLDTFEHRARWNARESRIEMHLESKIAQRVKLPALDLEVAFECGETIHTENSYKFTDERILSLLEHSGFTLLREWKDARDWFGVYLATAR